MAEPTLKPFTGELDSSVDGPWSNYSQSSQKSDGPWDQYADENTHQGSLLGPRPTLSRPEIFARLGSEANPTGQGIAPAAPAPQPAPEQAALVPPAQAAPAAAERHPTWRQNAIQAGRVARALGLAPKGKRLAQIVAEIDARDSGQNQAVPLGGLKSEVQHLRQLRPK